MAIDRGLRLAAVAALTVAALALPACGGDDEAADTSDRVPAAAPPNPDCREVEKPAARRPGKQPRPTITLNRAVERIATVRTSCGEFAIELDVRASPNAVASFWTLANSGYFDGTYFHRVVPGFVIQGGDPTGSGLGGPGYTTVDTPARSTTYTRGVVAMAKGAAEAPGTAGSQFFIVTAEDAALPPDYAVIGKVIRGLDVVQRIGRLGDPNTELPTQPVVIDSITVRR